MPSFSISRPHPIAEAIRRRAPLAARRELTAYRQFHGDAEGVPGLAIDRYAHVAVVHASSEDLLAAWLPELQDTLDWADSAYLKIHARRAGHSAGTLTNVSPDEPLWGPPVEALEVIEDGSRFEVRPASGLSAGLFLDMREVRGWLREVAGGGTVLNLFAYTCSFGVSAMRGGAQRVLNIDLSRAALDWGKSNYRLNELPVDDRDFVYGDALDWLGRLHRRGARFGLVVVDPPSFSSTPFSVTRDYPRLVEMAARVVAPAGMLLAATNHAGTSDERFDNWLRAGLTTADRHGQLVRRWHEPHVDFPVAAGRAPYLKVRALLLD